MLKKIIEDELLLDMQKKLASQDTEIESLDKAVDYLNSAAELLDDVGKYKQSNNILNVLLKIAKHKRPADPRKIPDRHTKGLTPESMVENLKRHGIPFNMADDNANIDILDIDIDENNPEESETEYTFEDET